MTENEGQALTQANPNEDPSTLMDGTRYEILRHAEDLFGHYGFKKTSMADIAERAKMSPGNLYRYYRNKQAIGVAVVDAFFRQSEAAMEGMMMQGEGPEERIRLMFTTGVRLIVGEMARTPKIMELVEFMTTDDAAYASLQRHIQWKREKLEKELKRGMETGRFDDLPLQETTVNMMHATKAFQVPQSLNAWREPETILPEFDGVLDLIMKAIRARA
ncbi:MAG: TetR/AcrR family transcriptional regulator [Pseudomonadota bacterium]